jgi:hypothetical protein
MPLLLQSLLLTKHSESTVAEHPSTVAANCLELSSAAANLQQTKSTDLQRNKLTPGSVRFLMREKLTICHSLHM